jgi:hypothetical protein
VPEKTRKAGSKSKPGKGHGSGMHAGSPVGSKRVEFVAEALSSRVGRLEKAADDQLGRLSERLARLELMLLSAPDREGLAERVSQFSGRVVELTATCASLEAKVDAFGASIVTAGVMRDLDARLGALEARVKELGDLAALQQREP